MNPDKVINWLPKSNKFQLTFLARNRNIEREMPFAGKALKSSNAVDLVGIASNKKIIKFSLLVIHTKID